MKYKCSGIQGECKGCIVTVPEMEEDCGRPDSCIWTRYTKNTHRVLWLEQSSEEQDLIIIGLTRKEAGSIVSIINNYSASSIIDVRTAIKIQKAIDSEV